MNSKAVSIALLAIVAVAAWLASDRQVAYAPAFAGAPVASAPRRQPAARAVPAAAPRPNLHPAVLEMESLRRRAGRDMLLY